MEEKHLREFEALPQPSSCRLIDFEKAEVVPGFVEKTFFLIVSGTKPWVTMTVQLSPLIYIKQPEYWGIEVIGCQHMLVPDAGHISNLENPSFVTDALLSWLDRHTASLRITN